MSQSVEPAADVTSRIAKSTVESAITALLKYKAAQLTSEKLQLLPQDEFIYLNLTLKKIPSNPRTNPFKIPLSHPVLDLSSQVCLIVDDRPKSPTPPSEQIKKLIKAQDIPISKVIKISKLKTNYKPFEAKRKLCDSYDLFLVDKRVVHLLPKLTGKEFFKKKKLPLGVDLGQRNLKVQVERALGSALLYLRSGTCCVMKVGKVAMEKDEVVENVVDAIKGAVERVPKKWDGVRSLHLKFFDSVALPLYQAMPDVKLKIEGLKEVEKRAELAKTSDNEGDGKETSGKKDAASGKRKKKGRIHEVQYMDVGEGIEIDDADDNVDDAEEMIEDKKTEDADLNVKGKKKNKSKSLKEDKKTDENVDDAEQLNEDKKTEDADLVIKGKKREKIKAWKEEGVLGELNGEKRVKKKVKSEKKGSGKPNKDELSSGESPAGLKRKKKSHVEEKPSEKKITKLKDGQHKKKASAK